MDKFRAVRRDLMAVDSAVYAAVAATRTPALDRGLRRLSAAADHSKLSLTAAGLLALRPGRARRAALLGVAAVGVASASTNLVAKQLVRRPRPDRAAAGSSTERHVPMPSSASFPSGHTAAAVAFATAAGSELPEVAVPLGALACVVGYSRVHTGVHYPGDVAAGIMIGVACAAAVSAAAHRWAPQTPGL
ncbi:membrane-associated phospholipid phosphatase [Kitasatospora sp. MAP12-15]|uniref:phosphatase PAP2 family protein n=1 Tax=unclassified Kitasatospora TaxID=2633591 RepID=UPI0024742A4C|nr:phosphatase PAP2 family protein [Kitasatospora sp. MAP12-44]MDH6108256.1 membrane-associated phospholipid phosphatase [Kitasatospora sp. MAP12-44]